MCMCVCQQLSTSSSVIVQCVSVCCTLSPLCVMLVVAANLQALLLQMCKCWCVRKAELSGVYDILSGH